MIMASQSKTPSRFNNEINLYSFSRSSDTIKILNKNQQRLLVYLVLA